MKECLPEEFISEKQFPKTYAWVHRFKEYVAEKKAQAPKPTTLDGKAMKSRVVDARSQPQTLTFIKDDLLKLQLGDEVEVFAFDYGSAHKDRGSIVGLTLNEVVIRNSQGLHVHFPRWNFRINKITSHPKIPVAPSRKIPKMKLIYPHGSSFVRKVYMLALELGLAQYISLHKVVVCPIPFPGWSDNDEDVAVYNPMAKIPCLIPEDVPDGIYDSRTICEYLTNVAGVKENKDARYWQMHTLHACADGILDAMVLITYELRIREQRVLKFDEWIEGQRAKILGGLDRFENAAKEGILRPLADGKPASAEEVAVVVATAVTESAGYIRVRWREGRPRLEEWMRAWEGRKSFVDTPPTKDWGAVTEIKSASKI